MTERAKLAFKYLDDITDMLMDETTMNTVAGAGTFRVMLSNSHAYWLSILREEISN